MKITKKVLTSILYFIIILVLFACGVNKQNKKSSKEVVHETTAAANMEGNGFSRASAKIVSDSIEEAYDMSYGVSMSINTIDRKIVKTIDLNTETKSFDESIEFVKKNVSDFDGVIDNSYVDSGNINSKDYRKSAYFTIRIPSERLDSFLYRIGDNLNITYREENTLDITDDYNDTESMLNTLKIEEENLNEMLKKAKTVEEMIKVEDKLSSIRAEIERLTRRMKRYDKQITYSTVHISVYEVKDLSEPATNEDDFSKETLLKQLKRNTIEVKKFLKRIAANIFTNIPWIILSLCVLVILLLAKAVINAIFGKNIETTNKKSDKKDVQGKENKEKKENKESDKLAKVIDNVTDYLTEDVVDNNDEVNVEFYQNEQ